jgi:GNAT superfamily N-acetyltransferase
MARLEPLRREDLPAVMAIERLPGYEVFVGRFELAEHEAELASPDARYLAWREGETLAGFVILQEFRQPTVLLRRIAVAEPGRGTGTRLFRAAVDWVFADTAAEAVKLHVRIANARARHIYVREGFAPYDADETGERLSVDRRRWIELHPR